MAEIMLKMFLRDFSSLYRIDDLTYNLHNLSHYGLATRRFGNMWSTSAYMWENLNGILQQRIHGSKNQGIELVKTLQICQGLAALKARFSSVSPNRERCILFRSSYNDCKFTNVRKNLLSSLNLQVKSAYYRAVSMPSGEIFTSKPYLRQRRKNNFTISYLDLGVKPYGEILCFLDCFGGAKMAFVQCFEVEHVRVFSHEATNFVVEHIIPIADSHEIHLLPVVENILSKVIRIDSFVCLRPNKYEVNL